MDYKSKIVMVLENMNSKDESHFFVNKYNNLILKEALLENEEINLICKNNNINLTTLGLISLISYVDLDKDDVGQQYVELVLNQLKSKDSISNEILFVTNISFGSVDIPLDLSDWGIEVDSLKNFIDDDYLLQGVVSSTHSYWKHLTFKFNKNNPLFSNLDVYSIGNGILGYLRFIEESSKLSEYSEYFIRHEEQITTLIGVPYSIDKISDILFEDKLSNLVNYSFSKFNSNMNNKVCDDFISILFIFTSLYNQALNNKDISGYFINFWSLFECIIKYDQKRNDKYTTKKLKRIIRKIVKSADYDYELLDDFIDIVVKQRNLLVHENKHQITQEVNIFMKFIIDNLLTILINNSNLVVKDYNGYIKDTFLSS